MPQVDILFILWVIVPILAGLIIIALILAISQVLKARAAAISKNSFEKLANELKEENTKILTELAAVREDMIQLK